MVPEARRGAAGIGLLALPRRPMPVQEHREGDHHLFLVYVDDLLIAASTMAVVNKAKTAVTGDFKARDLGEPD